MTPVSSRRIPSWTLPLLGVAALLLTFGPSASSARAGQAGDKCWAGDPCYPGLTCDALAWVCRAPGQKGDACHATRPCDKGLVCEPGAGMTCQPIGAGSFCAWGLKPCSAGYSCHPITSTCMASSPQMGPWSRAVCTKVFDKRQARFAREQGMTFSYGVGASLEAGASGVLETGVVYGGQGQFGCYTTQCYGANFSSGASSYLTAAIYPDWGVVPGNSTTLAAGVGTGKWGVGFNASFAWSFGEEGLYEGFSITLGGGPGLSPPVTLGGWRCFTTVATFDAPEKVPPPPDKGQVRMVAFDPYAPPDAPLPIRDTVGTVITRSNVTGWGGNSLPNQVLGNLHRVFGGQGDQFYGIDGAGKLHRYYLQGNAWVHHLLGGDFRKYDAVFGGTRANPSAPAVIYARDPSQDNGRLVVFTVPTNGLSVSAPTTKGKGWNTYGYVAGGWNGVVYALDKQHRLWAYRLLMGPSGPASWEKLSDSTGVRTLLDDNAGWGRCVQLHAADYGALYCLTDADSLYLVESRRGNYWQYGMTVDWEDRRELAHGHFIHVGLFGGYSRAPVWCGTGMTMSFPTGDRALFMHAADAESFGYWPRLRGELSAAKTTKPSELKCPATWPPPAPPVLTAPVQGTFKVRVAGTGRYLVAPSASKAALTTTGGAETATPFTFVRSPEYHVLQVADTTYVRNADPVISLGGGPTSDALWRLRLEAAGAAYRIVPLAGVHAGKPLKEDANGTLTGKDLMTTAAAEPPPAIKTPFGPVPTPTPPSPSAPAPKPPTLFELVPLGSLALQAPMKPYADTKHDWATPQATRTADVVTLSGLIKGSASGATVLATLPPELRPDTQLMFNTNRHASSARIDVLPTGEVKWVAGGSVGWFDLTGIRYAVRTGTPLSLASGWSGYGQGYRAPNYVVRGGLVHLGGLLSNKSASWGEIGHVFPDHRPKGTLRFAVGEHGKLQHVEIRKDGKIVFVAGSNKYRWLSLDGVAFRTATGQALPLSAGWKPATDGAEAPTMARLGDRVSLQGGLVADPKLRPPNTPVTGYNARLLTVLPEGMRPPQRLLFNTVGRVATLDAAKETVTLGPWVDVRVDVLSDGSVVVASPSGMPGQISLDGIVFDAPSL